MSEEVSKDKGFEYLSVGEGVRVGHKEQGARLKFVIEVWRKGGHMVAGRVVQDRWVRVMACDYIEQVVEELYRMKCNEALLADDLTSVAKELSALRAHIYQLGKLMFWLARDIGANQALTGMAAMREAAKVTRNESSDMTLEAAYKMLNGGDGRTFLLQCQETAESAKNTRGRDVLAGIDPTTREMLPGAEGDAEELLEESPSPSSAPEPTLIEEEEEVLM